MSHRKDYISEKDFTEEAMKIPSDPQEDSPGGSDVIENEDYLVGLEFDPNEKREKRMRPPVDRDLINELKNPEVDIS